MLNYDVISSSYAPSVLQRLGFDENGKRLRIDGDIGSKSLGASYFNPDDVQHPLPSVALQELLGGSQEQPVGRNSGSWVAKYYLKPDEVEKNHGAWCASFVGWCLRQVWGEKAPYSWGARRLFKKVCDWERGHEVEISEAQEGDVILWSRDKAGPHFGHIGIVCGQDEDYVYTIEGNSGPFVRTFRYSKDENLKSSSDPCLGVVRIK